MQLTQAYVKYGIVADEAPEPKAPAKTRRKTGNGDDGRKGRGGKGKSTRDRLPSNGANGIGQGEPAESGPDKLAEFGFEFAEEEDLTTWLQRLEDGANHAPGSL
jgi:hypothetical protein